MQGAPLTPQTDYGPLALAAGVRHYQVNEKSICTLHECPRRGCQAGFSVNRNNITVIPELITDEIRALVRNFGSK